MYNLIYSSTHCLTHESNTYCISYDSKEKAIEAANIISGPDFRDDTFSSIIGIYSEEDNYYKEEN